METNAVKMSTEIQQKIHAKIRKISRVSRLIKEILLLSQHAVKAQASSIILVDDKTGKLYFDIAEGTAKNTLKALAFDPETSIAGWVAANRKPLIVNDVSSDKRWNRSIDDRTGFKTRSILCVPLITHRKLIGVIEVLNKLDGESFTREDLAMLNSVASTAAVSIENTKLIQQVENGYKATIKALAAAIDAKDPYTAGHSQRVADLAVLTGKKLRFNDADMETLEYAAILHDVGKIGISDSILGKPTRLSDEEWQVMKQHPTIGANIVKDIEFLMTAQRLIGYHHEKYDGTGYPSGIDGQVMPVGAMVIAIADAYDAMTTARAYRPAMDIDYALKEIENGAHSQFSPLVIKAFLSIFRPDSAAKTSG